MSEFQNAAEGSSLARRAINDTLLGNNVHGKKYAVGNKSNILVFFIYKYKLKQLTCSIGGYLPYKYPYF